MDVKGFYTEALKEHDLIVAPHHYRWLEKLEWERQLSDEALDFVRDALAGKYERPRTGRFSPSSMGVCDRKLVFGFQGAPQVPDDLDAPDLMGLGKWGHLRWQAEGITNGWIAGAEVWTINPGLRVGGSIDAMLYDDSVFELKTIHPYKYTKVVQDAGEPLREHLIQFGTYTVLEGVSMGSIVYEDRSSGNFHEFRVEADDKLAKTVTDTIERVNNHEADGTLPKPLNECAAKRGQTYKQCSFREHCLKLHRSKKPR